MISAMVRGRAGDGLRLVRGALAAIAAAFLFLGPAVAAQAVPPLTSIGSAVTDQAGVVGNRSSQLQQALDEVANKTQYQLYVVYVGSFDGMSGTNWADRTATQARLGVNDLLLAVAVDDRLWGLAVNTASGMSASDQTAIENAIVDKLRNNDFAGAAIAGANKIVAQNTTSPWTYGVIGGVVVVGGGGGWLWWRNRRKAEGMNPAMAPAELAKLTTPELTKRAGTALVELDNALRSSEDELGFAQAEFGLEATDAFTVALAKAKQDASGAFGIQQKLDDEYPETEPQQRAMLMELLQLCDTAADVLDAQTKSFNELRNLVNRAGQVLDETEQRASEVTQRVPVARKTMETLTTTYPSTALASIIGNPDHATALVVAARDAIDKGRQSMAAGNKNQAVAFARVGQNAIAQAAKLLDAVDSAHAELDQAAAKLPQHVASLSSDLADVQRLRVTDSAVVAAAAEAQAALQQAQSVSTGGDPLAALTRLASAETVLDNVLAPARGQEVARLKQISATRTTIGQAQQVIAQANYYISARRAAIGTSARTRLSEATRAVAQAQQIQDSNPSGAYTLAVRGLSLAQQALEEARNSSMWESGSSGDLDSFLTGVVLGSSRGRGRSSSGWDSSYSSSSSSSSWGGSSHSSSSSRGSSSSSSSSWGGGGGSRSSGGSFGGGFGGRSGGGHF